MSVDEVCTGFRDQKATSRLFSDDILSSINKLILIELVEFDRNSSGHDELQVNRTPKNVVQKGQSNFSQENDHCQSGSLFL